MPPSDRFVGRLEVELGGGEGSVDGCVRGVKGESGERLEGG